MVYITPYQGAIKRLQGTRIQAMSPYEIYQKKIAKLERERERITGRLHALDDLPQWTEGQYARYEDYAARWEEIGIEISNLKKGI